jgi:hypothetical protein
MSSSPPDTTSSCSTSSSSGAATRLGERAASCWHAMAVNLAQLGAVVDARGGVDEVVTDARRQIAAGTGGSAELRPGGVGTPNAERGKNLP